MSLFWRVLLVNAGLLVLAAGILLFSPVTISSPVRAAEVAIVFIPMARQIMVTLLCALAITKAALVAMYFMHLKFERKTLALVVLTPLVLAGILILGLMPDTQAWFIRR